MRPTDLRGHVTPGGETWTYDLGPAVVRKCSVSEMDNNVYLITCTATGARLLIDAADDGERILRLLEEDDRSPGRALEAVLTTHRHWDHHRALADVVEQTGAAVLAGAADADGLPVPVDRRLHDGDTVRVGHLVMDIVHLRGHTPGSIALALSTAADRTTTLLFTGDSLFPGGPGRTTGAQDFTSLMDDLENRVFAVFDDDAVVLPGHGDNTTLGAERPSLGEWRERGW
ncbi:metallo-beta-lactamase superfamily protein [Serinicoccus hydrothermalis]|uniref:Metallo-beta-lactamase superfamily protein n=1 Tax=Serinicoccus hydrothermalis TaxID=1758689 RepID=A0A1B1N888_9MICO|nr:MBL fold metallo-hydrolase [Serinicoccus hydrothermalis]ANS77634.1 metallo-beta-lactamase superfamily protein [Serinicoccus hydrothermalis]